MKVGFGYAHNADAPGACHGDFCEHPESILWTDAVIAHLVDWEIECAIAPIGRLGAKVRAINVEDCDLAVEIHFNSVAGGGAYGSETLYYPGSTEGKRTAEIIEKYLAPVMSNPSRGAKEGWYRMDRPGVIDFYGDEDGDEMPDYWLRATNCPAVIIEPDFIQNVGHIKNRRAAGPLAIAVAIAESLGVLS